MHRKWWFWALLAAAVLGLLAGGRLWLVEREVQALRLAQPGPPIELETTSVLGILPLYEGAGLAGYNTGPGISYLITTDSAVILMDVASEPGDWELSLLEENIFNLDEDLASVQIVVISQRHPDHVGGWRRWWANTFSTGSAQPDLTGKAIYLPPGMTYPSGAVTSVTGPQQIAAEAATLGMVGFSQPFPLNLSSGAGREQALVVNLAGVGLVLVSAAGEPGVESLASRAEAVFGRPVAGLAGGYGLRRSGQAGLDAFVGWVQARQPGLLWLSTQDIALVEAELSARLGPNAFQRLEVGNSLLLQTLP